MNEILTPKPINYVELAVIALIAWIIAHLVALIVLTIVNAYIHNNIIYNAVYVTIVIGIAMLVIDQRIPEKMMAVIDKKRIAVVVSKQTTSNINELDMNKEEK